MTLCPRTGPLAWTYLRSQNVISNDEDKYEQNCIAAVRRVDSRILYLRDQKIILDADLAELYGVEVRHLNQQVKRNSKRFPAEFMFQLSNKDMKILRSQFVISNDGRGGRRYLPHASPNTAQSWPHRVEFEARHRDEHLRSAGFCANASSHGGKSRDRRQADRA
jgi:hypothetical protein